MTTGLEEKHGCESVHILSDTMEKFLIKNVGYVGFSCIRIFFLSFNYIFLMASTRRIFKEN
ncbi:hypothetical protein Hanom_Chr04g00342711 [Helianthus anomalus]